MKRQGVFRVIVRLMVLASAALTFWESQWWLLLTAFIGLNLLQSGVTRWCLLEDILGWLKVGEE